MSSDDGVIGTNDDAASCKRYAVEKGYWHDPFISQLVQKNSSSRKAPEISRGYYARVTGIKILVENFLRVTSGNCQIVNLGAGFDTLFWRLHEGNIAPKCFVEVDYEQVTTRKCHQIKSKSVLLNALSAEDSEIVMNKSEIHSGCYHLVSANLTNVGTLEAKLTSCGLDKSLPTLFIAECVLVYNETEITNKIIKYIADSFPTTFFVNYEQVNMTDGFGEVMMQNLKARDCLLRGVSACISVETQLNRFLTNGWTGGDCLDMKTLYRCLPQQDLQRIERIEMLDERELLDQLLYHYCIAWAYKDTLDVGLCTVKI